MEGIIVASWEWFIGVCYVWVVAVACDVAGVKSYGVVRLSERPLRSLRIYVLQLCYSFCYICYD